ncbi:MAG: AI-2E family transporter [Microscillaceae bacterium]|nr:AI-2E family transporter [Microscillaceae bacterium]MDW8461646.1 AI-2E family transporter [Cytophagales bacterium]
MSFLLHRSTLTFLAILLGVIVLSWFFSNIVVYLFVSMVLAGILRPITDYLHYKVFAGVHKLRILAIFISYFLLLSFFSSFLLLFLPLIYEQVIRLQMLDYGSLIKQMNTPINHLEDFLLDSFSAANLEKGFLKKQVVENVFLLINQLNVRSLLSYVLSFAETFIIYFIALSFITFFLLYEQGLIRRNILALVPNAYFEIFATALHKIDTLLSNYLVALFIQILAIFSLVSLGLTIVGIKYALTIAAFAAVVNLIPYLGPLIASLFGIVVGVTSLKVGLYDESLLIIVVKIVAVFSITKLIDDFFIQPLVFSKSVKAHPMEIFISIFAGATIAGGWGMLVAVPIYTVLRVAVIEIKSGYLNYQVFKHQKG